MRGFEEPFRQGGMGMDGLARSCALAPSCRGQGRFGDDVRDVRAGQVSAQQPAAVGASTTSLNTPASSPMAWALPSSRKLLWGQTTFEALLPGLGLGQAHRGHFGRGEDRRRNRGVIHGLGRAKTVLTATMPSTAATWAA